MVKSKKKIHKKRGDMIENIFTKIISIFLKGLVILILWNWLMPLLFHFVKINYGQACGIGILAGCIFGDYYIELSNIIKRLEK